MARPSLEEIFGEPDEFRLLDVKVRKQSDKDAGAKSAGMFSKVNDFFAKYGRAPDAESDDLEEMRLGTVLCALRDRPPSELLEQDTYGLLVEEANSSRDWRDDPRENEIPQSIDDIFEDDDLEVDMDLAMLKYATPSSERHLPDHRAEFVHCHDFEAFSELFASIQGELDHGTRKAILVRKRAIIEPEEGDFFIRNGLLAYIAEKSEMTTRGGSRDHRLRVIFSNGTESDPLMSSFRKSLNDDETARMVSKEGLGSLEQVDVEDYVELSGTIYVAKSLSQDPQIASQREILHKIGVTSQDVRRRIADARNDPTFLLAPVIVVATYELHGYSRRKVEELLHRFFDTARPSELYVIDRFGKKVYPREWFYVLPEHVSEAVSLMKSGELHKYRYDAKSQKICRK